MPPPKSMMAVFNDLVVYSFFKGRKKNIFLFFSFFRVIFRACQSPCASSTSPSTHFKKRSYTVYAHIYIIQDEGYIELEPV